MEIVIDIPEEVYKRVVVSPRCTPVLDAFEDRDLFVKALQNGKPLPKGHGDLITKEQVIELVEMYQWNPQHFGFEALIDDIKCEKPVIEADNVESEE